MAQNLAQTKEQKFLDDFKVTLPIIGLAGLGWDSPEITAAVSNAGALGVLHVGYKTPQEIRLEVARVRELTDKPFAVLLFPQKESVLNNRSLRLMDAALSPLREDLQCVPQRPLATPDFEEQFSTILELEIPAVGLRLGGLREPYMEQLEEKRIPVFGIASNLRDAKVLVSSGVNAVVAAGWAEAGLLSYEEIQPQQAEIDSLVLWSECARALRVPVLGAGSIVTSEQVSVMKKLGLAGFMLSDALLCSEESVIPADWRAKLSYTTDAASEVSNHFMGRPSRSLANGFSNLFPENELPVLQFPYQYLALKDIFDKALCLGRIELALVELGQYAYRAESGSARSIIEKFANYWAAE